MNNYESFHQTFLAEMPWRVSGSNDFAAQLEMLQENISDGVEIASLGDNVFKAVLGNQITYWMGDNDAQQVSIIVDTEINGNFCKVILTSKNTNLPSKSPPYASDLYSLIQKDLSSLQLTFSSDSLMSDDAIRLWNRIVTRGGKVSVFDTSKHQYILTNVDTPEELEKYIGGMENQKYIFVLSESVTAQRGVHHSVNLMDLKRISLYPLFEQLNSQQRK